MRTIALQKVNLDEYFKFLFYQNISGRHPVTAREAAQDRVRPDVRRQARRDADGLPIQIGGRNFRGATVRARSDGPGGLSPADGDDGAAQGVCQR